MIIDLNNKDKGLIKPLDYLTKESIFYHVSMGFGDVYQSGVILHESRNIALLADQTGSDNRSYICFDLEKNLIIEKSQCQDLLPVITNGRINPGTDLEVHYGQPEFSKSLFKVIFPNKKCPRGKFFNHDRNCIISELKEKYKFHIVDNEEFDFQNKEDEHYIDARTIVSIAHINENYSVRFLQGGTMGTSTNLYSKYLHFRERNTQKNIAKLPIIFRHANMGMINIYSHFEGIDGSYLVYGIPSNGEVYYLQPGDFTPNEVRGKLCLLTNRNLSKEEWNQYIGTTLQNTKYKIQNTKYKIQNTKYKKSCEKLPFPHDYHDKG